VDKVYGPFSAGEVERLNRDRFLVVPQRPGMKLPWAPEYGYPYDEMLGVFDGLGGPAEPAGRLPEHARFVGPDAVLHAFHKYFSERLKDLERGVLSGLLEAMLTGIYENALDMRSRAPEAARGAWDLAVAQMAVPLTLIETRARQAENSWEPEPEGGDSLEDALRAFAAREADLPEDLRTAVRSALGKVYSNGAVGAPGPDPAEALHLVPAYNSEGVDWTQFTPRSHYAERSSTRAYFRASIWLGQLGWKRDRAEFLPPLVAWAAALAGPGGDGFARAAGAAGDSSFSPPATPADAWRTVMRLTSFFVGFHEDPSLMEATDLLAESWRARGTPAGPPSSGGAVGEEVPGEREGAGAPAMGIGPEAPGDAAFLAVVAPALASLAPDSAGFSELRGTEYRGKGVISVLPQRFTVPWFIAAELTSEGSQLRHVRTDLPARFSGLYLAWALGSGYSASLAEREIGLGLANETVGPDALPKALAAMGSVAGDLASKLSRVPAEDWASSAGSAWFNALRTLTRSFGEGYPLYMRSGSFAAKQLETLLGSWTELKHDTVLYEKPNFAEMGEGGEDESEPKWQPKGFVEPNPEFWDAAVAAADALRDGFRSNGIFPDALEGYSSLGEFSEHLARLSGIARKELAGEALSEDDYEFIRTFGLERMAMRDGFGSAGGDNPEINLSGLVVDVQTVNTGDSGVVHEGLGPPALMLVLVANDGERRVTVGVAYDHYEFFVRPVMRLTDSDWKAVAYRGLQYESALIAKTVPKLPALPPKPVWYDPLRK
jgi:hypothetical protein